mgnify:CR=1 FL=1
MGRDKRGTGTNVGRDKRGTGTNIGRDIYLIKRGTFFSLK